MTRWGMTRLGVVIAFLGFALAAAAEAKAGAAARPETDRAAIESLVKREAVRMGVPIPLALAVAHAESYFNAGAESDKGARGVMQIMPATSTGEYGIHPDRLWEPRINVRLGLHFLDRLIRRYGGRVDLALSHYNGGSAVGEPPHARVIPATAGYVRRVLELRRDYATRHRPEEDRSWAWNRQDSLPSKTARATNCTPPSPPSPRRPSTAPPGSRRARRASWLASSPAATTAPRSSSFATWRSRPP